VRVPAWVFPSQFATRSAFTLKAARDDLHANDPRLIYSMKRSSYEETSMSERQAKSSRRGFLWGAAATGAAATAVATLPKVQPEAQPPVSAEPQPVPERGGGYRVSEHVLRYYNTTRI
jgi:hypothetical protein